jgi:DNA polymerase IV
MRTRPVILHLDLDAFFSAVEQLHKPSLRGKPVVVGGTERRGVVATASYEARVFGVGSAMPIGEARRRCPNAAYLAPRFHAYRAASQVVVRMLHDELSPLVEQVSVDEAYVDLTPAHPEIDVAGVTEIVEAFRARVTEVTGLTASVGAATSKLMAKIGSEMHKPNGLTVIRPGEEAAVLAPMPIRRLPGVGPATQDRLHRYGLHTVGEVADLPLKELIGILGQAWGSGLHQHARGIDNRELETEREAKSVSAEETFAVDLTDPATLTEHLRRMVDRVTARIAKDSTSARTITIKVRSYDFTTITRSLTLDQPTDSAAKILAAARQLLAGVDTSDGVRLLGVGVSGLGEFAQEDLLSDFDFGLPRVPLSPDVPPADHVGDGAARAAPAVVAVAPPDDEADPGWRPGQDVLHAAWGPGWVQGSGLGRVTVRFEGPHTPPGPIRTFAVDDPDLTATDPPTW